MIARVLDVTLESSCVISIFQVLGSASISTGFNPERMIAAAHEMIVKEGMMTSLPSGSRNAFTANSRAVEPLETAIPWHRPTRVASFSSNSDPARLDAAKQVFLLFPVQHRLIDRNEIALVQCGLPPMTAS
jgi:hypothetical protein